MKRFVIGISLFFGGLLGWGIILLTNAILNAGSGYTVVHCMGNDIVAAGLFLLVAVGGLVIALWDHIRDAFKDTRT